MIEVGMEDKGLFRVYAKQTILKYVSSRLIIVSGYCSSRVGLITATAHTWPMGQRFAQLPTK